MVSWTLGITHDGIAYSRGVVLRLPPGGTGRTAGERGTYGCPEFDGRLIAVLKGITGSKCTDTPVQLAGGVISRGAWKEGEVLSKRALKEAAVHIQSATALGPGAADAFGPLR